MTRPKRPTIERTLEHARKLKTLRENILDWRDEQRDQNAKLTAALADTLATFTAAAPSKNVTFKGIPLFPIPADAARDAAITAATKYCIQKLARRHCDVDDAAGVIAVAVCMAYPKWEGRSSFNTYAYSAAKRALQAELGKGIVSPVRAERRLGCRAAVVSLDKPMKGGTTLGDGLAASNTSEPDELS
jgi:hypothetical protein